LKDNRARHAAIAGVKGKAEAHAHEGFGTRRPQFQIARHHPRWRALVLASSSVASECRPGPAILPPGQRAV